MLTTPTGLTHLTPSEARRMIPVDQLADFSRETNEGRAFVLNWIAVLEPLRHIKGRSSMFAVVGRTINEPEGTVRAKYYAYVDGLNGKCTPLWEQLINRSLFPKPGQRAKDCRFVDFWQGLVEEVKRVKDGGRQAHRNLLTRLAMWEADPANPKLAIPGYQQPPARTSYCSRAHQWVPEGWSYRTLIKHKPAKVSLVNVIIGPQAAARHLPANLATRAGLKYREIVFTDDQDYDNEVTSYNNRGESMRPQGFNTLDYLTACFEAYGIQLRRRDEETGKRKGINQEFYEWTVLSDLMQNGFRDDDRGTRIIREHGTAKGRHEFDQILHHITGGRVWMDASGRFDAGMFAEMFFRGKGRATQAVGNFRYKAPLESAFHRLRTASGNLLGHTGLRYDIAPEHAGAMDGYTRRLFKAIEKLPPEKREVVWNLARHHKHDWYEFAQLMAYTYEAVNSRRDHRLEGWEACGFIIPGYAVKNPAEPWQPPVIYTRDQFAALTPEGQHYVKTFGQNHNIILSPAEARAACRKTDRALAYLGREIVATAALPIEWAYPRRRGKDTGGVPVQQDGTLVIRDPERFGADALIYLGQLHTPDGDLIPLRPGDQYLVHVNPVNIDEALILALNGRYRGYLKLMPRPCANDIAARLRHQGEIARYKADVTRDGRRRAEPDIQRGRDIIEHNERLLAGDIAPSEEAIAEERARLSRIAELEAEEKGVVTVHHAPDLASTDPDEDEALDAAFRTLWNNQSEPDN